MIKRGCPGEFGPTSLSGRASATPCPLASLPTAQAWMDVTYTWLFRALEGVVILKSRPLLLLWPPLLASLGKGLLTAYRPPEERLLWTVPCMT